MAVPDLTTRATNFVPVGDARYTRIGSEMFLTACGPRSSKDEIQFVVDLIVGGGGNAHAAGGGGERCEAGGDIERRAVNIAIGLLDDIAKVDADAQADAQAVFQVGFQLIHGHLDLDRAGDGIDCAAKFREHAIAGKFENAPRGGRQSPAR